MTVDMRRSAGPSRHKVLTHVLVLNNCRAPEEFLAFPPYPVERSTPRPPGDQPEQAACVDRCIKPPFSCARCQRHLPDQIQSLEAGLQREVAPDVRELASVG